MSNQYDFSEFLNAMKSYESTDKLFATKHTSAVSVKDWEKVQKALEKKK